MFDTRDLLTTRGAIKCLKHEETTGLYVTFVTTMISQPMLPKTIVLPVRVLAPGHSAFLIDVCNSCVINIHDQRHASHVVLLPCAHAYHAFYYAQLSKKVKCLFKDCVGVISAEDQSLLKKKGLVQVGSSKEEPTCTYQMPKNK